MRKTILFLLTTLLYISCGGDDGGGGGTTPSGSEYLNVSNIEIPGGNTTATLIIQASNNCEWVVSSSDAWIRSINPTKGRGNQNVTITVTTNPSSSAERTAIVNVRTTSGSISRNVTITQSPSAENLQLSMNTMTFSYTASSQDVTITSNTHWTVSGTATWLTLSRTEGDGNSTVKVSVDENTTETERNAVLTFKGDEGAEQQLRVTQAGHITDFNVSPSNFTVGALGSTIQFVIAGNAQWTIQSNREWATLSDMTGEGGKTITVTLADNTTEQARNAEITIMSSSKSISVSITQSAATKPEVSGLQVTNITRYEATVSFSFNSMFPVTEYGVCYSTEENPAINGPRTTETGSVTQGSYSTKLTGLASGKTYYLRAYAKSAVGFSYSNNVVFTTKQGEKPNSGDNYQPGW